MESVLREKRGGSQTPRGAQPTGNAIQWRCIACIGVGENWTLLFTQLPIMSFSLSWIC